MEQRSLQAESAWRPAATRRRMRLLAVMLAVLMLLSPALAAGAGAAEGAEGLAVHFMIGGCELSITGLTSPDGSALCSPTVRLVVAGIACTYQPFSGCLGVGGVLKCFIRMLSPFVAFESR